MKIGQIPFGITEWPEVEITEHKGIYGTNRRNILLWISLLGH